jgi:hypothetical protein
MRTFYVIINGKICGTVEAINGDLAWELTKLAQPNAERLQER